MADLDDLIVKVANIDAAIENALENEVALAVKDAIVAAARENVYDAYTPKFLHRRNGSGGILDTESIRVEVNGTELTAMDTYPGIKGPKGWQQLWKGDTPDGRLAEAIASGDRRYNMHLAGPRPFHEEAKRRVISEGTAEAALRAGLARQGYDTSGMKFQFE